MILLDTNVLIYASTDQSPFLEWARRTIAAGVSKGGAAVNAVSLAEICVGDVEPETVADRLYGAIRALLAACALLCLGTAATHATLPVDVTILPSGGNAVAVDAAGNLYVTGTVDAQGLTPEAGSMSSASPTRRTSPTRTSPAIQHRANGRRPT